MQNEFSGITFCDL